MNPSQPNPTPPAAFNPRRGKLVSRDYLEKLIKKGVGSGERESYRPWLKIRSVPSRGTSRVVPGVRVARGHHCLSNGEFSFFVLMEFNQDITDIREQFPLLDYDETHSIALQKNIKPARYIGTDVPFVHTADFMLSYTRAGADATTLVAISLKYRSEIANASVEKRKRIFEKQEIEKEYWARRGVESKLCFFEDLPHMKIKNLIIIRSYANLPLSIASDNNVKKILQFLSAADPVEVERISLRRLLRLISQNVYIEYSVVKELVFYLIWHKRIIVNLDEFELGISKPLMGLTVPSTAVYFGEVTL
ncbi:Tn7 transposase TnsA N-terminal domain-containing protein [Pseudomonas fulva]|uniref:Tn7 transposase TnsA N-terminal domain-containing protein n=1 Tax=Pseudomonas fulva TaxID=47880 RepID=A0A7S9LHG0_9PSED|nr:MULTISPECIES: TnsA endonuclease N-terminal domain-containing protein [Pseudomonas]AUA35214.1 endonuclease [Pseudomonas sp. SGAir0191]MBA1207586.1 endonuclease [Pseudomonas fulva]MBA1215072.1 endonuclease [Pseudomonas fulva]MBF8705746.1 Tn7 transposase TnsA N-terminal domain-containing protein [Pseudomonas putida]MCO7058680.1 TnsA endonuclease N-terminal domain-containing protein [Pseudomonas juntendi]